MRNKKYIERLNYSLEIFEQCVEIFDDIKYLQDIDKDEIRIIEDSGFLMRQIDMEWRILIIELQKLFSKNENYSLFKLMNCLINNYKSIDWFNFFELINLKENLQSLNNTEICNAIKAIDTMRSKYIVHYDKNRTKFNNKVKTKQVELLISVGDKILKDIYSSLTGNFVIFNLGKSSKLYIHVSEILDLKRKSNSVQTNTLSN